MQSESPNVILNDEEIQVERMTVKNLEQFAVVARPKGVGDE